MCVRYIHTQAQALAELERERAARRASYARRKERTLNGTPAQAQTERERHRAVQKNSHAQRKETMLNDPEYRKQVLHGRKISRDKKRLLRNFKHRLSCLLIQAQFGGATNSDVGPRIAS
jgi:hypothetical protein